MSTFRVPSFSPWISSSPEQVPTISTQYCEYCYIIGIYITLKFWRGLADYRRQMLQKKLCTKTLPVPMCGCGGVLRSSSYSPYPLYEYMCTWWNSCMVRFQKLHLIGLLFPRNEELENTSVPVSFFSLVFFFSFNFCFVFVYETGSHHVACPGL